MSLFCTYTIKIHGTTGNFLLARSDSPVIPEHSNYLYEMFCRKARAFESHPRRFLFAIRVNGFQSDFIPSNPADEQGKIAPFQCSHKVSLLYLNYVD